MSDQQPHTTRRNALRTIGGAALAVAGIGAASGEARAMSASGYEVRDITGTETIDVQSEYNGVMENVLLDQRGHGNMASIHATGDFVIRNVGFRGTCEGGGESKQIQPVIEDSNGEGLIENVYLPGSGSGQDIMGFYARQEHAGHVTIRNVYIEGYDDNGVYVSVPGSIDPGHSNPRGGTFGIESCYSLNNNISGFRLGSDGSYISDSVVVVTGSSDPPAHPNGRNARGIWFRNNASCTAQNCDVWNPYYSAVSQSDGGSGARLVDSRVNGSIGPNVETQNVGSLSSIPSPPAGVPTDAFEAASGSSGGDGGTGNGDTGSEPGEITGTALEILGSSGAAWFTTTAGAEVERLDMGNDVSAVGEDFSTTRWPDGTLTVNTTLSGNGDAFDVIDGGVLAVDSASGVDPIWRWNSVEVTDDDLPFMPPDDGGTGNGDGNGDTGGGGDDNDRQQATNAGLLLGAGLIYAAYRRARNR